jgi:Thioredoxin
MNLTLSPAHEYWEKSFSYQQYKSTFEAIIMRSEKNIEASEKEMHNYYTLNWARSKRVEKVYTMSDNAKSVLSGLTIKQKWIVITEAWCGDSSQSLPILAALAEYRSDIIDFRICSRDLYPELLELYKTNGSMGIPKLIAIDSNGIELFTWGTRPIKAQEVFDALKHDNQEKSKIYEAVHLWYAKDKGQTVEIEIVSLLK